MNETRKLWLDTVLEMAGPVLNALAERRLKERMPFLHEGHAEAFKKNGNHVQYLEALGRLLAGLAPWLELEGLSGDEKALQDKYRALAREAIDAGTDKASPDYFVWSSGGAEPHQSLVDAAYLSEALLRAPRELVHKLDARVKANLFVSLKETSGMRPVWFNNWILFSATVEDALNAFWDAGDYGKIELIMTDVSRWYKGGGFYGDGESFAWDYYNSYVIQPMLMDLADNNAGKILFYDHGKNLRKEALERFKAYLITQERAISPDGTYLPCGRSIVYRLGAFHALALGALKGYLPERLKPGQVRRAMTSVIRKFGEGKNYDAAGWLVPGVFGEQRKLMDPYNSSGSFYMASLIFLPLGLAPTHEFWTAADQPTTWEQYWTGMDLYSDVH
ncbi:MAG: DUF2264 domain-containing protein [Clostridiales bacterium]|jgi:hypothetical protein|nr:DUF2264 domain-containing protein [Clostridiales bacterium]